jgi:hypothetical protein
MTGELLSLSAQPKKIAAPVFFLPMFTQETILRTKSQGPYGKHTQTPKRQNL